MKGAINNNTVFKIKNKIKRKIVVSETPATTPSFTELLLSNYVVPQTYHPKWIMKSYAPWRREPWFSGLPLDPWGTARWPADSRCSVNQSLNPWVHSYGRRRPRREVRGSDGDRRDLENPVPHPEHYSGLVATTQEGRAGVISLVAVTQLQGGDNTAHYKSKNK